MAVSALSPPRGVGRRSASPTPGTRERESSEAAAPFVKWAGGKRQLLPALAARYPNLDGSSSYHEPFLGGGAVFLNVRRLLRPARAFLSDTNASLISLFRSVRDEVEEVLEHLRTYATGHDSNRYYEVRGQRAEDLPSDAARAARFIYLNKTCFNGLYRVNRKGLFNVPAGRYRNPRIFEHQALRAASSALAGVSLEVAPFHVVLENARAGDFVYLDPPYDPVSSTAAFTAYTADAFGPNHHRELSYAFRALDRRGCNVLLSNSDTAFVRTLYAGFDIERVAARRAINSRGDRRGPVHELLIRNYCPPSSQLRGHRTLAARGEG